MPNHATVEKSYRFMGVQSLGRTLNVAEIPCGADYNNTLLHLIEANMIPLRTEEAKLHIQLDPEFRKLIADQWFWTVQPTDGTASAKVLDIRGESIPVGIGPGPSRKIIGQKAQEIAVDPLTRAPIVIGVTEKVDTRVLLNTAMHDMNILRKTMLRIGL